MATNEASFKTEFRRDLELHFGKDIFIWANSDKFRSGLPDFSISHHGTLLGVEAKFIKEMPARETTEALEHPVSATQIEFIANLRRTGNSGIVLIGLKDVAVIMNCVKPNYTAAEIRSAPRIVKDRGHWRVDLFFDIIKTGDTSNDW